MRRKHLFEFMDLPWLPAFLKDGIRDFLYALNRHFRFHTVWADKIAAVLEQQDTTQIIDLCSGGAGPAPLVYQELRRTYGIEVKITMTDLYPSRHAIERIKRLGEGDLDYIEESVDASDLTGNIEGVRTMFSAFHHMPPDVAKKVLQNAQDCGHAICVFETTENTWKGILSACISPLGVFRLMATVRPIKITQLLFTYIIPVFPLLILWDALVSNLRTYSPEELRSMLEDLNDESYHWELGKLNVPGVLNGLPYLIGIPTR